jgi:alpha-beta hydrolase superfamily lysophospholipase
MYDAVAGPPEQSAVLLCAPWGWEEIASYRVRREIAQLFTEAGHPTLRFDLPAVGNSSGTPADEGLLDAWTTAIADAAAWLREESGRNRVTVLGLGLGGTLAMAALDRGAAIDELILWAAPARGRRFVREIESFAKLQAWSPGRGEEAPLPDGWVEAGGFVLSAETVAALKALAPLEVVPARLRRALLLDRDGIGIESGLEDRLRGTAEVTIGSGTGWGKMVFHPEFAVLPEAAVAAAIDLLAQSSGTPPEAPTPPPVARAEELTTVVDGEPIRESVFRVPTANGCSFAVLAEPAGETVAGDVCVVFLNSGAVRHVGPNRNWVENARHWAARGLRSIRIDLDGIGEADGERSLYLGASGFYSPEYGEAVLAVLDEAAERGLGDRFVCVGLCSGAYWALQMADRDPRVESAVLLNVGALVWHVGLRARREVQWWVSGSLSSRSSWKKLLRFEVNIPAKLRIIRRAIAWRLGRMVSWIPGVGVDGPQRFDREIEVLFDRLAEAGTPIAMSFSANEPVLEELEESGIIDRFDRWPNIDLGTLAGEDHALGPIPAQRSGRAMVDRELGRVLAREADRRRVSEPAGAVETGASPPQSS